MGPKQRLGFAYRFVIFVLRPLFMVITKRDWRGAEHLPPEGVGVVVVANHLSHVDPITFGHFLWDNGRAARYLAKESVFRIPVIGRIIAACGQIPVYRESRDATRAYAAAVEAVEAGECVAIYPEGTITRDPTLWPMAGKTGAARIALATGCAVIPVAQWGPQEILAPYTKRPRILPPKTIHIHAGPPVPLDDLRAVELTPAVMRQATDRIIDALTEQLASIRQEIPPAERFDPRATAVTEDRKDAGEDGGQSGGDPGNPGDAGEDAGESGDGGGAPA